MMRLDGCHALITGASSGIGREFACQLAGRAALLVLVARRLDRLEELRSELAARNSQLRIEIRRTDLTEEEEINALVAWVDGQNLAINLLINNAGLGDLGAFATADPEKLDRMMLVNMVGLTRLTRGLLPRMIARERGTILNVSSSAGFLPLAEFCGLRRDESLRDQFVGSVAGRVAWDRSECDRSLSRTGANGIHGNGAPPNAG